MKERITLSIAPKISLRAKRIAHVRKTTVSGLVERFFERASLSGKKDTSFVSRWAGKFSVAPSRSGDMRMRKLKERFKLK